MENGYKNTYFELMVIIYRNLLIEENSKKFEISSDFKKVISDVIIKASCENNDINNLSSNSNFYKLSNFVYGIVRDFTNKMKTLGDDLDAYEVLKSVINTSVYIKDEIKESLVNELTDGFNSIYNEEKYNELMNERSTKKIIVLDEQEFINLMEAHHRWKWGNHMQFIVEKKIETANADNVCNVKPRYVYREGNSEFYVDMNLVKTILCECFEEYDIENIEFNTSYVKHEWVDYTQNIRRDSHGNPADQDSMRMMRHPGMYQGGTVSPTFNNIVIYAREKKYQESNEYKLAL